MFVQVDEFDLQQLLFQHRKTKYRKPHFPQTQGAHDMLDCSNQKIVKPPAAIFTQPIRILNLNDNFIKHFDFHLIRDMPHLQNLLLRNNLLQDFQPQHCHRLLVLDLSLNHIKLIRTQVAEMTALKQLYIAHNNFTELPIEILNLRKTLHLFQLDWMKYSTPPTPELIADRQNLMDFFQALEETFLDFQISNDLNVINFTQFITHPSYVHYAKKHHQESRQVNRSVEDFKQCKLFDRKCSHSLDQKKAPVKVHKAVLNEDLGVLRVLIEQKNSIDELDKNDHTPLSLAILEEKYLAAKYLLYSHANPNLGSSWFGSCLNIAISKLQYYLVRDLIQNGASLSKVDQYENDCIHYLFAVWTNNPKEAEKIGNLVLSQKVNPNRVNMHGYTVVHLVCKMGNTECVRYMLRWNERQVDEELKFDFWMRTVKEQNTTLHQASLSRNIELVEVICREFGEQITQKNAKDVSPLEQLRCDLVGYKVMKKYERLFFRRKDIVGREERGRVREHGAVGRRPQPEQQHERRVHPQERARADEVPESDQDHPLLAQQPPAAREPVQELQGGTLPAEEGAPLEGDLLRAQASQPEPELLPQPPPARPQAGRDHRQHAHPQEDVLPPQQAHPHHRHPALQAAVGRVHPHAVPIQGRPLHLRPVRQHLHLLQTHQQCLLPRTPQTLQHHQPHPRNHLLEPLPQGHQSAQQLQPRQARPLRKLPAQPPPHRSIPLRPQRLRPPTHGALHQPEERLPQRPPPPLRDHADQARHELHRRKQLQHNELKIISKDIQSMNPSLLLKLRDEQLRLVVPAFLFALAPALHVIEPLPAQVVHLHESYHLSPHRQTPPAEVAVPDPRLVPQHLHPDVLLVVNYPYHGTSGSKVEGFDGNDAIPELMNLGVT